jgi:hypothetical protein
MNALRQLSARDIALGAQENTRYARTLASTLVARTVFAAELRQYLVSYRQVL